MSELAFNLSGERFELPAKAAGWRVRRLKPKGAPEVVYGRSGIPLILPIDADVDDLRHEARLEGRYRLDPVDEHGRGIETAAAGYVCVQPGDAMESAPTVGRATSENPVIEAMRMNTELARTIIEKFPLMIESAAVLLRAADGAGLPARPPHAIAEPVNAHDDEDDDGEDEDEGDNAADGEEVAPKASGWASLLDSLVPFIAPAIVNAVTSGKLSIPGGLGALFDCRRAGPKASPSVERAAGVAPVSGPSDPAPARRASSPPRTPAPPTYTPGGFSPASSEAASVRAREPRVPAPPASASGGFSHAASETASTRTREPHIRATHGLSRPVGGAMVANAGGVPAGATGAGAALAGEPRVNPPRSEDGHAGVPIAPQRSTESHAGGAQRDRPPVAPRAAEPRFGDTFPGHLPAGASGASEPRCDEVRAGDPRIGAAYVPHAPASSSSLSPSALTAVSSGGDGPRAGELRVLSHVPSDVMSGDLPVTVTSHLGAGDVALGVSALDDETPFAGDPAQAPAATAAGGMDALPTLDPAALVHFAAIQRALTLRESMLARALAAELSPADLRAWLAELREMSLPDAVAKIRGFLRTVTGEAASDDSSGTRPGGVS